MRIAIVCSVCAALGLLYTPVHADTQPRDLPAPMEGRYPCFAWMMTGMTGGWTAAAPTFGVTASGLGVIIIDGKGAYRRESTGNGGSYRFDPASHRIAFRDGPLDGLSAIAEVTKDAYRLRFPGPDPNKARLDQFCDRKTESSAAAAPARLPSEGDIRTRVVTVDELLTLSSANGAQFKTLIDGKLVRLQGRIARIDADTLNFDIGDASGSYSCDAPAGQLARLRSGQTVIVRGRAEISGWGANRVTLHPCAVVD